MLKNNPLLRKILGEVEINTLMKRLEGKPLKQTERNYLSRSIRPKLLAAKFLTEEKIFLKIHRPNKSIEKLIIFNLSRFGYDFITTSKIKRQKCLDIEELISIIITNKPKPRFIEAIPIILLKNQIDKFKLAELAIKYQIINQIGYLIETAMIIAEKLKIKHELNELYSYLKNNLMEDIAYLGEETSNTYKEFLQKTSPKRISKWNLLGRYFDEDFIKNAKVYL